MNRKSIVVGITTLVANVIGYRVLFGMNDSIIRIMLSSIYFMTGLYIGWRELMNDEWLEQYQNQYDIPYGPTVIIMCVCIIVYAPTAPILWIIRDVKNLVEKIKS